VKETHNVETGERSNRFETGQRIAFSLALFALLPIAAATSRANIAASVFDTAPESADFQLVYSLDIPNAANYSTGPVPYSVDNHRSISGPVDRIAYYVEVAPAGGQTQFVFASMDAFTQDLSLIGIPTAANGAYFQRNVRNMNVTSNVVDIVNGMALPGGNIEFWRSNYTPDNIAGVPSAQAGSYDAGDNAGGPGGGGTYGSFQIHNHDARQTLFAYNRWNDGVNASDLGIGNNAQTTADNRMNTDWTFRGNAGTYNIRKLQILVRLGQPTRAAILPLGMIVPLT
jgi:sialate O-acetylesterase